MLDSQESKKRKSSPTAHDIFPDEKDETGHSGKKNRSDDSSELMVPSSALRDLIRCPITSLAMGKSVLAADGCTYDEDALLKLFDAPESKGATWQGMVDGFGNRPTSRRYFPNIAVKNLSHQLLTTHCGYKKSEFEQAEQLIRLERFNEAAALLKTASDQNPLAAILLFDIALRCNPPLDREELNWEIGSFFIPPLAASSGTPAFSFYAAIGHLNWVAEGTASGNEKALTLLRLAAERRHMDAQFSLGNLYLFGTTGVEKDEKKAVEFYQLAADQKHATAQYLLGICYGRGAGVEKDEKKAAALYQLAADQGLAAAQWNLASCYGQGSGVEKDEKRSIELCRLAADRGNADAQRTLGILYKRGADVEKDEKKAIEFYQLAVDQGDMIAQNDLGICYEGGTGVEKDEKKAIELFRLAANQGYAAAQCNLGNYYEHGVGVQKDEKKAIELYHLAANQGYAAAQYSLGFCYAEEIGVKKDEKRAAEFYQMAAEQGHAAAQYRLGLCYNAGIGVEKDHKKALSLLKAAEVQGHKKARSLIRISYAPMLPSGSFFTAASSDTLERKVRPASTPFFTQEVKSVSPDPLSSSSASSTTSTSFSSNRG